MQSLCSGCRRGLRGAIFDPFEIRPNLIFCYVWRGVVFFSGELRGCSRVLDINANRRFLTLADQRQDHKSKQWVDVLVGGVCSFTCCGFVALVSPGAEDIDTFGCTVLLGRASIVIFGCDLHILVKEHIHKWVVDRAMPTTP